MKGFQHLKIQGGTWHFLELRHIRLLYLAESEYIHVVWLKSYPRRSRQPLNLQTNSLDPVPLKNLCYRMNSLSHILSFTCLYYIRVEELWLFTNLKPPNQSIMVA